MTRAALLSLLATSLLAQAPAPAFRTWTSTDGRKVEASLLTTDGTSVSIKLRDGKVFSLPLDR